VKRADEKKTMMMMMMKEEEEENRREIGGRIAVRIGARLVRFANTTYDVLLSRQTAVDSKRNPKKNPAMSRLKQKLL
jgi:hypothetical protein